MKRIVTTSLAGLLLLVPGNTQGGPPPADAKAGETKSAPTDQPASASSVPATNREMEADMGEIGQLKSDAQKDGEVVRQRCLEDVEKRANAAMKVATDELLVIRDSTTTPEARAFSVGKLNAAAERLRVLTEEARQCAGEDGDDEDEDATKNEQDKAQSIPIEDPTLGPLDPIPPPVDDTRPPVVASPPV